VPYTDYVVTEQDELDTCHVHLRIIPVKPWTPGAPVRPSLPCSPEEPVRPRTPGKPRSPGDPKDPASINTHTHTHHTSQSYSLEPFTVSGFKQKLEYAMDVINLIIFITENRTLKAQNEIVN